LAEKRYYWLKLKDDFFAQKEIKKLRKIAGGDTYTIIYLKLQLLSLKNEGIIAFEGIEENFIEEMALVLDEDVENVRVTILYLQKVGFLEEISADEYLLPQAVESIGSETTVAARVRKHRESKKLLQCNTQVTKSNTEIDIEKDIEKDINNSGASPRKFIPPTLEEVQAYCKERNNNVDAERWYNFYTSKGWMIGKNKMKDWKAAVRTWEKGGVQSGTNKQNNDTGFRETIGLSIG
jgi:predicted phage replisome organizer